MSLWDRHRQLLQATVLVLGVALVASACGATRTARSETRPNEAASHVTISWQINDTSPESPTMKPLVRLVDKYEQAHPGVRVRWVQTTLGGNDQQAYVVTQAAGGTLPDITMENWATVLAGEVPNGILANLMPYLQRPNPYVKGNKHWLDLWPKSIWGYMEINPQKIELLVGSNVETAIFYNKKQFRSARIKRPPTTWAQFVADLKLLKKHGYGGFLFADGGPDCNPSWYERNFETELLHDSLSKFKVSKGDIETNNLDIAVGVERGIISMNNPAYAEGWKLLGSLRPYLVPGDSSYDACSPANATTPPLSPITPFEDGKATMVYATTGLIPELNAAGFKGKYGLFAFPQITKATTKYSPNVEQKGAVGGPNGPGLLAVATPKADHSMTKAKMKAVMNLVAYLYSPQNEGAWVNGLGEGADPPLIKGAKIAKVAGLNLKALEPSGVAPTVIQGIMNGTLSTGNADSALRLLQAYLGGSMAYGQFATKFQAVLQQGVSQYAAANHINLSKYKSTT